MGAQPLVPFIDSLHYLNEAIRCVENNPIRCGLRAQKWNCVVKLN
jgi:hypothetical protein